MMVALAYTFNYVVMEFALPVNNENLKVGLIDKARSDPEAFAYLFRLHYDEIFQYCARRLFDRTTAEDLTSQIFLKAFQNLSRFRGNLREFKSWLFKIATNEINSHLRSQARKNKLLQAAVQNFETPPYIDPVENAEKIKILKQVILNLKPKYQAVIALRFFQHMDNRQIADILGLRQTTVRSQISRAIQMLRENFNSIPLKGEMEKWRAWQ